MKLTSSEGASILSPTEQQIAEVLGGLGAGFASLARDELTYMQAAGSPEEGFVLEHQEGSPDRHFQAADTRLPLETVVRAFQLYATGEDGWRTLVAWHREEVGIALPAPRWLLVALAAAASAVAFVCWRAA